jgi:large subunit ribosomal protein L24e
MAKSPIQFQMKRNPRKLKWTKAFRKSAGKEMVVDSTLRFAVRRNVPIRYNRDLVATTLKAMQRVSEIRQKRERVFYKKRMEGNRERERAANRRLVAENEHLLPKMRGSERLTLEKERVGGEVKEEIPLQLEKAKLFGKQKIRRKVLVDGGIEDEMEVD